MIDWLNTNAPDRPVAFFGGNPVPGLKAKAFKDQWQSWPYSEDLNHFITAAENHARCRQLGIEYLIAPADGKTRYLGANRPLKGVPAFTTSGRYAVLRLPANPPPDRSNLKFSPANPTSRTSRKRSTASSAVRVLTSEDKTG